MAIYYSATTSSFYDSNIIEITQMPEDSKIVTDANYKALMDAQCDGHVITANSDGTPCAITQQCGSCSGLIHDLTIATAKKLGHVKGGGNVSIDTDGVMNVDIGGKANDSDVVHKSGDETIAGNKTFSSMIVGNLQGNADTATKATSADSVAWENVTGRPSIPTTPIAYVTETWASGYNWYRKWSDGFIEQGGFATGLNLSNGDSSINLPVPFSNANYIAVLAPATFSDGVLWSGSPPTRHIKSTTTTLKWGVFDGRDGQVCWYACGYQRSLNHEI